MPDTHDMKIATEAAEWLLRLQEDSQQETHAEFMAWLKRSPRHMGEFLFATATLKVVGSQEFFDAIDTAAAPDEGPSNVVALSEVGVTSMRNELPRPAAVAQPSKRAWLRWASAAACIVGLGLLAWFFAPVRNASLETYSTQIGEQRSFRLDDGSLLYLNTDSRATVRFSSNARAVQLLNGEALFVVATDKKRPFQVHTAAARVQAVGTQFNVYQKSDATIVSVLEGRVRVAAEPGSDRSAADAPGKPRATALTIVASGQEVQVTGNGQIVKHDKPNMTHTMAWRQRRLIFEGTPLTDVIQEFNRYNRTRIRVQGAAAAALEITGVFNADEPQALLTFLREDPMLDIRHTDTGIVVAAK